ncbi:transcription factor HHO3-like [Silene latifolia]|uniref:transcription factor HHO3-like n=1 Tax=Silene latifolia TaxID=37657 RepID=UPI003D77E901
MGLICPEFSFDMKPETIHGFLKHVSLINDVSLRHDKVKEFITRLETELSYIQVFGSQFPLSILLLNDAIKTLKKEALRYTGRDDCHCQPVVLEEFIPLKKDSSVENTEIIQKVDDGKDKKTWMSSVQLWNADDLPSTSTPSRIPPKKRDTLSLGRYKAGSDKGVGGLSLVAPKMIKHSKDEQSEAKGRKQRRCWSGELHRRFVDALTHLGGAQVATPKQIRELMRVDGLTNDEVKSHLQKYRLHTRRIPTKSAAMSPEGPLQLTVSTTAGDSMEDEDDGKSENY